MDVRACADEQQEDEEERLEVEEGRLRELVRACCLVGHIREHTILATNREIGQLENYRRRFRTWKTACRRESRGGARKVAGPVTR